jgi:ElaB/YqjD/DUF883 family membrane-anchored ribosome-binding protein
MTDRFDDKRINEALELLNEVARDKKVELQGIVSNKYGELRSAIGGVAGKLQHDVVETYHRSTEKVKELASEVDESVHKNPWPYLGGTALGFLILGYFLGRSKK